MDNDYTTKEGLVTRSVYTFASSWQIKGIDSACEVTPDDQHACSAGKSGTEEESAAKTFCEQALSDKRFAACHSVSVILNLNHHLA